MPILPTAITANGEMDKASQRRVVRYCFQCGAVAVGHFGIALKYQKIDNSAVVSRIFPMAVPL